MLSFYKKMSFIKEERAVMEKRSSFLMVGEFCGKWLRIELARIKFKL